MHANQALGRADIHMHTTASDGLYPVKELLDHVEQRGHLDVIAITDHDTLDASLWAYERREQYPFDIVPGLEVSSRDGHVLALWVTQPIPRDLSLAETAAAIHEAGGVAVLAHPFHVAIGVVARSALTYIFKPHVILDAELDAVEVHNAAIFLPGSNLFARIMTHRLGVTPLANSDAHTLGAIGSGRTLFPGSSADDLRQAIMHNQTRAVGTAWPLADYWNFITGKLFQMVRPQPSTRII
jgi:hypothetical protein